MKKVFLFPVVLIALTIFGQKVVAQEQEPFSQEQSILIKDVAIEFSQAMGDVAENPGSNCPGLRSILRSRLDAIQTLVQKASQLPTEVFVESTSARNILDAELALKYIDSTCSSYGV